MPVVRKNLGNSLQKVVERREIIVQYPFVIEPKTFSFIYLHRNFKLTKAIVTVVNTSTTQTSFTVETLGNIVTLIIRAGENKSSIWIGEIKIPAGSVLSCRSNTSGTGSFVTFILEGEYC